MKLKLEQAVFRLVVGQKLQHVVEHAAEQDNGRAFRTVHAAKELVQLVHFLGPGGGKKFLGVGDDQNPLLKGRNVLVKVGGEIAPVCSIHYAGRLLHHTGGKHLGGNQLCHKVLARAGISQDKAVHANPGAAGQVGLGHLELFIQLVQLRHQGVFGDEALLGALRSQGFSAKSAVFGFRAVILSAFVAIHRLSDSCC